MPQFLLTLISDYENLSNCAYVLSRGGKPIEPRNIQYRFNNLLVAADVKLVNFHSLRHTFSVRALESGFDVKSLSEILGHASATVTLKKYAHSVDEHKRNRMAALESVYN